MAARRSAAVADEVKPAILQRMERLWTPWRYDYVTGAKKARWASVPKALEGWPGSRRMPETGSEDTADAEPGGCAFCNIVAAADYAVVQGMATEDAERSVHMVARGPSCFVCLNAFPYSTGHVLLVPYRHVDSLAALTSEEAEEMIGLTQKVERVLGAVYRPQGMNFGLNLGKAAGAGVAGHLHLHALPRWTGDTNFMTTVAETRILPESLEITWHRMRELFPK